MSIYKEDFKLTSVKLNPENYANFKKFIITNGTSLHKLVNNAISLYLTNNDFRNKIDNNEEQKNKI